MLVLGSLATAFSDVVADSIVVELSRGEPQVCVRVRVDVRECACVCLGVGGCTNLGVDVSMFARSLTPHFVH